MDGRTEGGMDGWMDIEGWMEGRMDGQANR